jgi:inositol phosphorylceramide synthase catalytic subunit
VDLRLRPGQLRNAHWFYRLGFPLIAAVYLTTLQLIGGLEAIHYTLVGLGVLLCLWNDGTRRLARIGLPFLLYGAVYDSMRYYADYIRSPVIHVREPYDFDLRFFSLSGLTPNEWLQRHTSLVLDFFCGLAYTPMFFIGESVLLSIYLLNLGESQRAERFVWCFVIANFIGFACYYIYPAAPPWYVADHGFTVDLTVRASPAGAIRFDQLIGFPLMQSFYGKSADVFGAIPSLHVVYPFLSMFFGWKLSRFRPWAIAYWLLVCFSAIYLNHHYLLDLFVGLGIACFVIGAMRALFGPLEAMPQVADDLGREPVRT